jgi:membrane-associated phospholipid phosphatase
LIEFFKHIDQQVFVAINTAMQTEWLDALCPFMRMQSNWYILYVIIVVLIIKQYKMQGVWIILGAALLILLSDQISANLIKNTVKRLRPCNQPDFKDQVRLLVACGNGFSYLSAHATNHFAIAVYLYQMWGKQFVWFLPLALFWASLIAFSQVYVGVHYPLDVLSGAILGSLLAWVISKLMVKFITSRK